MKAISIKQPWATLIADGAKAIELRAWQTDHRGPLLIVSSAEPAGLTMPLPGGESLPLPAGRMLAVVDLVGIEPATGDHAGAACIDIVALDEVIEHLSDALPPRTLYAWHLARPRHVRPAPVRGRLSLYSIDDALIELLDDSDHHANHL